MGAIFLAQERFEISPVGEEVRIAGSIAFVICGESVNDEEPTLIATNIALQVEPWLEALHHHASPVLSEGSFDALIEDEDDTPSDDHLLH